MYSDKIEDYVGQDIIARGEYYIDFEGEINTKCYMYPLYMLSKESGSWETIENRTEAFPERGAIEVDIKDGQTAQDVVKKNRQLFKIKLTVSPQRMLGEHINNIYKSSFNKKRARISYTVIEEISSASFMQIIKCSMPIEHFLENRKITEPDVEIYTEKKIILENNGYYFGPFEIFNKSENMITLYALKETNFLIGKFEKTQFPYQVINEDNIELINFPNSLKMKDLLDESIEQFDGIPEKELIILLDRLLKGCQKGGSNKEFNRDIRQKIRNVLEQTMAINEEPKISKERLDRIIELFDKSVLDESESENILTQLTYLILQNPKSLQELIEIALKLQPDKIKESPMVKAEIQKEQQELQDELTKKKNELKNLDDNLKIAYDEKEQVTKEIEKERRKIKDEIQKENEQRLNEISELEEKKKINEIEYRKTVVDIEKVNKELKDLQEQYNQKVDSYKQKINEFKNPDKVIEKALDKALLEQSLRIFHGDQPGSNNEIIQFDLKLLEYNNPEVAKIDEGKKIIDEVSMYLKDNRRNLERNDVINLLLCITQGFITTFAGEPGTGKTSMSYLLAKALGLARTDQNNRFIEVSVERGWTSSKDFIGYYNPLSKQYEKSNPHVYRAIEILNQEGIQLVEGSLTEVAPFLILLDEANLSPIEHYWANFLRISDINSCQDRTLNLGGEKSWKIPEHLRFLATVNFDHTTEELSPRFLDRSWVIVMKPQDIDYDFEENEEFESNSQKTIVPFSKLYNVFGKSTDEMDDDAILEKWKTIQTIFLKNKMPIAPRNLNMIHNYCKVANLYMDTNMSNTRYDPLDYAISQKVLPLINGIDTRFEDLISDLVKECKDSLPRCADHLDRIQAAAKETQYYQFFSK